MCDIIHLIKYIQEATFMSNSPDLMLRSSYYYDLPQQLIAQTPAEKRDMSRLLVLDRKTGEVTHRHFHDITDYLRAGDCLVINDTKVIPSRLFAKNPDHAGEVEVVLLSRSKDGGDRWECLVRPGKKAVVGDRLVFSPACWLSTAFSTASFLSGI